MTTFLIILAIGGQLVLAPVSFQSFGACQDARIEMVARGIATTACETTV